ncbi:PKD domain-containing protein [Acidaminobacter sp.]|uniref:PKD domain-containing protein n=1 Tax=Acidaminobacter sp. TaxID=1872102 RepID=UPI00256C89F9|nr:PKD domain-containing protein [Acidaminobacter sp.]MDK9712394.1 PKD domain-containing protein [Acidaminobacter sp.]
MKVHNLLIKRTLSLYLILSLLTMPMRVSFALWTDYDGHDPVHQFVDLYAYDIYQNDELGNYLSYVKDGARHEDLKDHIFDRTELFTTITHFWDADNGPGDQVDMVVVGDNSPNAWQKAQILWGIALGEYAKGDKPKAFEALGHVTHLLADMSVPAHVHEDSHKTDIYEDWMEFPTAYLSSFELDSLVAKGPIQIPEGVSDPLYYLFYTTNQVADMFPSDDEDGDVTSNGDLNDSWSENGANWMTDVYNDNLGFTSSTPQSQITYPRTQDDLDSFEDVAAIREYCYSYGIRAVAALYKLFEEASQSRNYLTVIIDEVDAQDPHEDPAWGADFYAVVSIEGANFRNEGDQVEDIDHIHPYWAFGRYVGLEGQKQVCIQIYDEDDDPNPDEKTDLDPKEGPRDLDIVIDLATGNITGDVAGMCGTTLTSAGAGDDQYYSYIAFRIILPNMPPVAHAGEDQTVDEGDTVTLSGTFEDPNVEDTHTLLWHLESATNGQAIPDTATDTLSFVPDDNGTYTFTFTVTDNYGASDTDEVVITAENVAPEVSIDRLFDETDMDIGLDVPVALINLEVNMTASFTDAGTADTHFAKLLWGDVSPYDAVFSAFTDSTGGVTGSIAHSHIYQVPGELTITLQVFDDDFGVGSESIPITVVDASGALESVIEMLMPMADDPNIKAAIGRLQGEKDSIAANGGLDMLNLNQQLTALEMIKQAIKYLDAAEAATPGLDLSIEKGLLALAAKSITVGEINDAAAIATKAKQLKKIDASKLLVISGDQALASGNHLIAVGKYQEALRGILGI